MELVLETPRLLIIVCTATSTDALARRRGEAEALQGIRIDPAWPQGDLAEFLPVYAAAVRDDPSLLGFGIWLVVERAENLLVGDVGFKGKPRNGSLEIGYSIVPARRGKGLATEAGEAIMRWGLSRPGVERVVAECAADNVGSIRVLEKLGMRRAALSADGLIKWST